MKLCTFSVSGGAPVPGRLEGDRVVALGARDLVSALASQGDAPEVGKFALADVRLHAPVPEPPSVRDFFAFEQHVATARANRGAEVPAEWYQLPVFYFSNPAAIFGPEDGVPHPRGSEELDYELEVAAVIGAEGEIAGFTVMNDWSARDLQRQEVRVGLGPAKGKDFATSLGPVLVTVDEFDGGSAEMVARVNGEERSRGNLRDLYHPWKAILERASLNTHLRPGEVLGSGTVGTGCILEADDGRWLSVGDVVELEVEGIGVLRNTVVTPR
jgi:fumarylacetoacetate (FAA) hydrolase